MPVEDPKVNPTCPLAKATCPSCGEVFPGEARIQGKHIAAYAEALAATDPELYERRFSRYLAAGVKPDELPHHFEEGKANILNAFKEE